MTTRMTISHLTGMDRCSTRQGCLDYLTRCPLTELRQLLREEGILGRSKLNKSNQEDFARELMYTEAILEHYRRVDQRRAFLETVAGYIPGLSNHCVTSDREARLSFPGQAKNCYRYGRLEINYDGESHLCTAAGDSSALIGLEIDGLVYCFTSLKEMIDELPEINELTLYTA